LCYFLNILPKPPGIWGVAMSSQFLGFVSFRKASRAMRKMRRRCPEVELLESLTLLSGLGLAAHQASAPLPNPLPLMGTVHGTFKANAAGSTTVTGSGVLNPLGKVTKLSGGSVANGTTGGLGNLTVSTKQG